MYALRFKNELPAIVAKEMESFLTSLKAWLSVAHTEDGEILNPLNPGVRQVVSATVTTDVSTTSGSMVDLTGASITMTTLAGSAVLLYWSGASKLGGAGADALFTFNVDGRDDNVRALMRSTDYQTVSFAAVHTGMAASSHTFKVRFRNSDGATTHTVGGTQSVGQFLALEIKVS